MSIDNSLANIQQLMRQLVTRGSLPILEPCGGQPLWDDGTMLDPSSIDEYKILARPSIRGSANGISICPGMWPPFYRRAPRSALNGTKTGSYATRRKTVEYAFPTRITRLATANTIAGATRHDTAAITIKIPETESRVFLSVRLVATYHTEYAATNSVLGWLLGVNVGGTAIDKINDGFTAANTANKNISDIVDTDLTRRFNEFFTGTSQSCFASIAVRTTNADNINNITLKLVVTYEYNAREAVATRLKTIRIPIQSQSTTLTNSQQELGVDGNAPAPTKQIPALDTFLPENSKVYDAIYLELFAQNNGITTTDFTPYVQIDAVAEVALATIQQSVFNTAMTWQTIYDLTGLDTSVAHTLSMRTDFAGSGATGRLCCPGGFLVVTYEYNPATTTSVMCEAIVPISNSYEDDLAPASGGIPGVGPVVGYTDSPNYSDVFVVQLDVQETNPVLAQSGLFIAVVETFTAVTHQYAAQGLTTNSRQTFRDYTIVTLEGGNVGNGDSPFVHRCDTGTGWVIQRGLNRLIVRHSVSAINHRGFQRGFAVVNYTANAPTDTDAINHPVHFYGNPYTPDSSLAVNYTLVTSGVMRVPVLGSPYKISGVMLETLVRYFQNQFELTFIGINPGEWDGAGFIGGQPRPAGGSTIQTSRSFLAFTRAFNADNLHTGKLDVEKERLVARQFDNINFFEVVAAWSWWITFHQMSFTVAGVVTVDGSPVAANKTIQIYAYSTTGPEDVTELVTTTTTAMDGSGSFTVQVPGNTRTYFASYANDGNIGRSIDGVPGTSTFNITIGAAGRFFFGSPFIKGIEE
jgi:hypothetical protein